MQQIFKGMDNGASTIDANFTELANANLPTANKTVQDLTVNGKFNISGNQKVAKYTYNIGTWAYRATRIGNIVQLNMSTNNTDYNSQYGADWAKYLDGAKTVPIGFRPVDSVMFSQADSGGTSRIVLNIDGTMNRRGSLNYDGGIMNTIVYLTNDAWPAQ